MTAPNRPDRSAFYAALGLWVASALAVIYAGLEVTDDTPRRWLGHWIVNVYAFIGWIPALLLARKGPAG